MTDPLGLSTIHFLRIRIPPPTGSLEESRQFELWLLQRGVEFPQAYSLQRDFFIGSPFGIPVDNPLSEHQKILNLGIDLVRIDDSRSHFVREYTLEIHGRRYGIKEGESIQYHSSLDTSDIRSNFRPYTIVYLATPDRENNMSELKEFGPFMIVPGGRLIYPYRAWPVLLFLALITYTLIFCLRRPIRRAVCEINELRNVRVSPAKR